MITGLTSSLSTGCPSENALKAIVKIHKEGRDRGELTDLEREHTSCAGTHFQGTRLSLAAASPQLPAAPLLVGQGPGLLPLAPGGSRVNVRATRCALSESQADPSAQQMHTRGQNEHDQHGVGGSVSR